MGVYIEIAQFAWNVCFGIGTLVALVWSWTLRRSAADAKSLSNLEADLRQSVGALGARLGRVEERVSHLPTDKSLADIRDVLAKIGADIGQLKGEQQAVTRSVEHMNRFLMERER